VQLRQAIDFLEQAIAADPECAVAVHNQGVLYGRLGEEAKCEELVRRSMVIDPDYLYAYCTLASQAHARGDLEGAKVLLEHVASAPQIESAVYLRTSEIRFWLSLDEGELDAAAGALGAIEEFAPDYPRLQDMQSALRIKELGEGWLDNWQDYHHKYRVRQLRKPITTDAELAICLDRISRERLAATLRAWTLPSKGRKAEVIDRLAASMLDPEELATFIDGNLTDDELSALAEVLEQGGIMPYHVFLERYGDETMESPHWQYHTPETVAGRLQMFGLLVVGTLEDEEVLLIPADLRPHLLKLT
jgi:tetratricopeptide (TPR) repeat protein